MLEKNTGQTDRTIRAIVGAVLVVAFFMMQGFWAWLALVVGVVLLATSAMGTCPSYSLLGIDTRKTRS